MLVLGLTGGIATGKSAVSRTLAEKHHLTVIDADQIAREVVFPGRKAYKQIVTAFGDVDGLVRDDGSLNREALGRHVFGNRERLRTLNGIVHPAVKKEMIWQVLKAYLRFEKVVVLDVPLLFESGLSLACGKIVTISCEETTQLERLLARNKELTAEDAQKRIASQMNNDERNRRADFVIDNNSSLEDLEQNVDLVVKQVWPNTLITVLDYFPPIGLLSAFLTVVVRYARENFEGRGAKKNT